MGKLTESTNLVKTLLKDLVTADNTEAIAKVNKALEEVESNANTMETENISLKDKIVEMVKGTISTEKPSEENDADDTPKDIDTILMEEADKIVAQGGK